jgi:2-polyprenyl-3-methyl-5-hydroxy-6-metoxy-1,4-benzoquinol methylase
VAVTESEYDKHILETSQVWDAAAAHFDDEPDHGLRDAHVRQAWLDLLQELLPWSDGRVLDIGCGTGSLSIVLAGLGFDVTGIDISPAMIARAQEKAEQAGHDIQFQVMEAADPQLPGQQFDAVLCRHLLWALPEPKAVLRRWLSLLSPGGWLVLIEGYWHPGAGIPAEELLTALPPEITAVSVQNLSDRPALWGRKVSDERYAIKGRRA